MTRENKMVDVRLTYDKGLDRYYGLLELALKHGIFKSVSTRVELPDGTKLFGKQILKDPEKHFTKDILKQLDNYAKIEYTYGITNGDDEIGGEEPEGDDTITDKESL